MVCEIRTCFFHPLSAGASRHQRGPTYSAGALRIINHNLRCGTRHPSCHHPTPTPTLPPRSARLSVSASVCGSACPRVGASAGLSLIHISEPTRRS
eukprot:6906058-Prymnesium_polylepis.1